MSVNQDGCIGVKMKKIFRIVQDNAVPNGSKYFDTPTFHPNVSAIIRTLNNNNVIMLLRTKCTKNLLLSLFFLFFLSSPGSDDGLKIWVERNLVLIEISTSIEYLFERNPRPSYRVFDFFRFFF